MEEPYSAVSIGIAEFMTGPSCERTRSLLHLFENRMRERGFVGNIIRFKTDFLIGVIVQKYASKCTEDVTSSVGVHREDQWPEVPGSRIKWSIDEVVVESDHFSIRPLFHGHSKHGDFAGSSLQWVAAAIGAQIDMLHLSELMLVTHNLDDRTLVPEVHRFNPGDRWIKQRDGQATVANTPVGISSVGKELGDLTGKESAAFLGTVAERIASFMNSGACVELTSGLDSRCNIALGNWVGAKPKFAFTLGAEHDKEVQVARELCRRSGVEHKRIDINLNDESIATDTDDYLEAASYQVNAGSYCWMPELFRLLAPERDIQLCGQAPSSGFYYTPFDVMGKFDSVVEKWATSRLIMSGNQTGDVLGEELNLEGRRLVITSARELLRRSDAGFRDSADEFFIFQRTRQWAGYVVNAARYWYQNQVPLLDSHMTEWIWRGRKRHKSYRINQMRLCEDLGKTIAGIPFNSECQCPNGAFDYLKLQLQMLTKLGKGINNRIRQKRRCPDSGALEVATLLAELPDTREGILGMFSRHSIPNHEERCEHILSHVSSYEREIGFLVTAQKLQDKIDSISSAI